MSKKATQRKQEEEQVTSEAQPKQQAKQPEKKQKRITAPRFNNAQHARLVFYASPEKGTTVNDLLKPEYWGGISDKINTPARIECLWEDNTQYAELVVFAKGRGYLVVGLLNHVVFDSDNVAKVPQRSDDYTVSHEGNHYKWAVVRKSDKMKLQTGFETEAQAHSWLAEFMRGI